MKQNKNIDHYFSGPIYRIFSGLFGVFLIVVGIAVLFIGVVAPILKLVFGIIIILLGAESVWAAIHSKQSWLAKLGPFI